MMTFHWSWQSGWFWMGLALFLAISGISLWNAFRRQQFALEGLRIFLAALLCLALTKPETWRRQASSEPPTFVVLQDHSGSMETLDMPMEEGQGTASRQAWMEAQTLEKEGFRFEKRRFESRASGRTNIHAALTEVLDSRPLPEGIVLYSDGDWNAGESPETLALRFRRQGIPVVTVPVGQSRALPDIRLQWLPMPKTVLLEEPTRLPFRLENHLDREVEVTVTFQAGDEADPESRVLLLAPGQVRDEHMLWRPETLGAQSLTLTTPVLPGETREDNNVAEITVDVKRDRLQVLVIDSAPRWEFRYLRNALMRDPNVDLACVLFHPDPEMGLGRGPSYLDAFPPDEEALNSYDVVFLGDVGVGEGQLTEPQALLLRGLVEDQASGLVFIPGRRGHQARLRESSMEELFPVSLDPDIDAAGVQAAVPSPLELTPLGRESVLTMLGSSPNENAVIWRSLPGFYWHAPVLRAKAGSQVLAVHAEARNAHGRLPLLVTRPFGMGKVLYLGTDGAWRWRRGVEDRYHYRFWSQVAQWMAYQRNLSESARGRIIAYPESPKQGREVSLHATLLDGNRSPLTHAEATVRWQAPSGEEGVLTLAETGGAWGAYRGQFTPEESGPYQLDVLVDGQAHGITATLAVGASIQESIGDPARPEVLRRLAEATGGTALAPGASVVDALQRLRPPETIVIRREWWHHPLLLTFLIGGLGLYWWLRKRAGLI